MGILCYTQTMQEDQTQWERWSKFLETKGVREVTAIGLEAIGPLRVIAAQLCYAGAPIFSDLAPSTTWHAIAGMLEDREKTHAFISYLREESLK